MSTKQGEKANHALQFDRLFDRLKCSVKSSDVVCSFVLFLFGNVGAIVGLRLKTMTHGSVDWPDPRVPGSPKIELIAFCFLFRYDELKMTVSHTL
jgi:hypothetical protein